MLMRVFSKDQPNQTSLAVASAMKHCLQTVGNRYIFFTCYWLKSKFSVWKWLGAHGVSE